MMIVPIACTVAPLVIGAAVLAWSMPAPEPPAAADRAAVSVEPWGTVDGKEAHLWTLTNGHGMTMKVTDWGTIITELWVPDRAGKPVDVVLGRPSLQAYVDRTQYFGCTAGRCANRIAKGTFTIDGKEFHVPGNNGPNSLHGGNKGFDKRLWSGEARVVDNVASVTFTYVSADGEEGYPGTCTAKVTYTLTPGNELKVLMEATTDTPTVVNLAHHTYWNLGGQGSGAILDHVLKLDADRYTPVDATLITTGEIAPVAGTPLDFRKAKPIGQDFAKLPATKDDPGGYDHNFVVNGIPGSTRECAVVTSPRTGITMTVRSNQPGIQFYSGNFLDGVPGKNGAVYAKNDGLCLETQAFPDSVNKQGKPGWPDVILRPGKPYRHEMVHAFTAGDTAAK
jgi:aldose 1-epimerase